MNYNNNRNTSGIQDEFEVDVDNMQVLQNNQNSIMNESQMKQNINDDAVLASNDKPSPSTTKPVKVQNMEDDGNGFFITGINTDEQ